MTAPPWTAFRTKRQQAVSDGVADAINGVWRPQRPDTVFTPGYWRDYNRGYRDFIDASDRDAGGNQ